MRIVEEPISSSEREFLSVHNLSPVISGRFSWASTQSFSPAGTKLTSPRMNDRRATRVGGSATGPDWPSCPGGGASSGAGCAKAEKASVTLASRTAKRIGLNMANAPLRHANGIKLDFRWRAATRAAARTRLNHPESLLTLRRYLNVIKLNGDLPPPVCVHIVQRRAG